jgi:hypothetical protein
LHGVTRRRRPDQDLGTVEEGVLRFGYAAVASGYDALADEKA